MPSYPPARDVINTTYVAAVAARTQVAQMPAVPTYLEGAQISQVTAERSWHVTFQTGKATFTPDALAALAQIRAGTEIGAQLIQIHGHTDSTGNPAKNRALSGQRAQAVKQWLMKQSPVNYPDNRIKVYAHGDAEPVADNSTEDGRAQNRRVDIVLGR
jgi:outer membrane protein OmpA-like peptidoglycan-associated protein